MEKSIVTIRFDQEKIDALRVYLGHKNSYLEVELEKAMDTLYGKVVPTIVREFIREKSELNTKGKEV